MTFNKNFRKPKTSKKKHYDKCNLHAILQVQCTKTLRLVASRFS